MAQELESHKGADGGGKRSAQPNGTVSADAVDLGADDVGAPKRETSFARFARDVIIVAALLGGGAFLYWKNQTTKQEVAKISLEANDKLEKDDLDSLKAAEEAYKRILELDGDNERGLLGLAETYFYMSQHGLPTRDQAEQFAKRSMEEKGRNPDIYAMQAYIQITSGRAAEAVRDLKELLETKEIGSSKILHAYGWAHLEQGEFVEANRLVRGAQDTDFNAVRFALTLAEIAHRQGEERAAVRQLRNATAQAMNPTHEVANAWLAALSAKNYGNITSPAKLIQDVAARKDKAGPRANAMLAWAEGELALAVGNAGGAIEKAQEAQGKLKDYAPFLDLEARALVAQKKTDDAVAVYEKAVAMKPSYRGIRVDLLRLLSDKKDDRALAMIDELQKAHAGAVDAQYEILRGEHYLKKGDVEQAKGAFTRAAELGDDPAILFGLARVAFLEEKKKDKKADLERVATAFEETITRRSTYPEAHAYMATIALWNFDIGGASASYTEAETQFKKLNRPIAEMLRFYDGVVESFQDVKEKGAKGEAEKAAAEWKKKKDEYLSSVVTASAE